MLIAGHANPLTLVLRTSSDSCLMYRTRSEHHRSDSGCGKSRILSVTADISTSWVHIDTASSSVKDSSQHVQLIATHSFTSTYFGGATIVLNDPLTSAALTKGWLR